jgi:hypothetical protein
MRELTTSEIIGGLFIGAVLFLILRRNNDTQTQIQQSGIGINNWKSLNYVPTFEDVYSKMIQPVAVSQPVEQNVEQGSQIAEQKVEQKVVDQIDDNSTQYKNKEVWKIMRDDNGDIAEISVSRDARVT